VRTKIVATIGPASKDRVTLEKMVKAGLDVARLNFSHGQRSEFKKWIEIFREISREKDQPIAIIQDLQGPRIRTGEVPKPFEIKKGQKVKLVVKDKIAKINSQQPTIPLAYQTLMKDIREKDRILIDNGKIELRVSTIERRGLKATVTIGGKINSHKGINLPDTKISLPTITKKDREDLKFGAENKVDYIALSFVRSAENIKEARKLIEKSPAKDISIIAKIETREGLKNIDRIIKEADGIMIGRGDLGIELPMEEVPLVQKRIINKAREAGKPVITATQMLSSMVNSIKPTRAEVSDVANAILDGTDAVMLSEESAVGKYPLESVQEMEKIIKETEAEINLSRDYNIKKAKDETRAIGISACRLAQALKAKYIACATTSGFTARMISLHRPITPIVSYTPNRRVYQKLALVWGIDPYPLPGFHTTDELIYQIIDRLKNQKKIKKNDLIIITAGHPVGRKGNTNLLKVQKVENN